MTCVVDASVVAEVLLGTRTGRVCAARLGDRALVAPAHLGAEVASVIRGLCLGGHLEEEAGLRALVELPLLGIEQLPTDGLLVDAFRARQNLSAYDALYVALARRLAVPLLTLDARMAAAAPDCAELVTG